MQKILKLLHHRAFLVAVAITVQLAVLLLVLLRFNEYYRQFNTICLALSLLIVVWIVGNRSNPAYKIAWIIPIMLFPIFGWLLYLLFGGNRLPKRTRKKMQSIEQVMEEELQSEACMADTLSERVGRDAGNMARYLERTAHCPVYGHTQTEYFPLGEAQWESILRELKKAKRYIFLEFFILEPGKMWDSVLSILEEKAAAGVEVRVLYDDIGCMFTLPRDYDHVLRKKGIQCCVFNRFLPVLSVRMNNRDHRKILVIDGQVAYTGGVNLADEYINVKPRFGHWKDTAILLRGEAAWSFTVMFLNMWDFTAGKREDFTCFRPEHFSNITEAGYVQPYGDSPLDDEPVGETVYLNLINKAERYVYLTTPYLIIDHATTTALVSAAKAGVDVRIITPHIPDKKIIFELTRAHYGSLLEAGVQIFEYTPGFIHAKIFAVDDRYGTVGTVNMDYRSMFLHFEDGVVLYETPSVLDIKDDFLATQARSKAVSLEQCRAIPWYRRFFRALLRVFAPLL
jgi:cardiolipin synthase